MEGVVSAERNLKGDLMLKLLTLLAAGYFGLALTGCQPKTPAEKAENKIEDTMHESKQGMERAGDRIDDATK
jgi:hypothetical protein